MNRYLSFHDAFFGTLKEILENGIVSKPRGSKTYELIGHSFIIENPRDRILNCKLRNINPDYLVGNVLWVLSQSNKLDFIQYYNSRGINFSDDGEILRGAYGKRLFDIDGVNQIKHCIDELRLDPDSRRALASIHMPQHDWHGSVDTPCTADVQFLIRDNKLIMINHMRSQSAAFVMPYDIFLMTMLHELIANELDVELGYYQHFCGSIHFFEREMDIVNEMLDWDSKEYKFSVPMKPFDTKLSELKGMLNFEKDLRETSISTPKDAPYAYFNISNFIFKRNALNLNEVTEGMMDILLIKAAREHKWPDYLHTLRNGLPEYFKLLY